MIAAHEGRGPIDGNRHFTSGPFRPIYTSVEDQAKLLGPLLVEENLLVPEQLDHALQFAEDTGLPLDQILVAEFAVSQPDISRLLARAGRAGDDGGKPENVVVGDAPIDRPFGVQLRRPIGQIFVDLGFITPDDREAALTVQRESGGLLGEILITQGKLTRLELANALSEHWESGTKANQSIGRGEQSLSDVPREEGSSPHVEPSAVAELRGLLAEVEAARIADGAAVAARIAAIDDALATLAPQDDEEFRRTTGERLQQLAEKVESLVARAADVEPSQAVNDLEPTPTALAQSVDDLNRARAAEAEATRITVDELRERLDELIALRATDLEGTQAANSQAAYAAAEASRIEQTLAAALAELAGRVDDLTHRLDAPSLAATDTKKQPKGAKSKKKPKR